MTPSFKERLSKILTEFSGMEECHAEFREAKNEILTLVKEIVPDEMREWEKLQQLGYNSCRQAMLKNLGEDDEQDDTKMIPQQTANRDFKEKFESYVEQVSKNPSCYDTSSKGYAIWGYRKGLEKASKIVCYHEDNFPIYKANCCYDRNTIRQLIEELEE